MSDPIPLPDDLAQGDESCATCRFFSQSLYAVDPEGERPRDPRVGQCLSVPPMGGDPSERWATCYLEEWCGNYARRRGPPRRAVKPSRFDHEVVLPTREDVRGGV